MHVISRQIETITARSLLPSFPSEPVPESVRESEVFNGNFQLLTNNFFQNESEFEEESFAEISCTSSYGHDDDYEVKEHKVPVASKPIRTRAPGGARQPKQCACCGCTRLVFILLFYSFFGVLLIAKFKYFDWT